MNEQRQKQTLAVLLVVFGLVVAWRSLGTLEGRGSLFGGAGPTINVDAALRTRVAELDLERLDRKVTEVRTGRNPWRFEEPPPRRVEPPVKPPPAAPPRVAQDQAPAQPVEPAKPQPPPVDVELRGILGPERLRIAVFEDGEAIINAVEGAVLKGSFRVEKIQIESVLLAYVDFPDAPPVRLPIRGG